MTMKRVVILGAPGAGKGTQAKKIAEYLGIPHMSTGAMLRSQIDNGTELGNKAKEYMVAGNLVPDEVVNDIVATSLKEAVRDGGFLLDGYPRNLDQVHNLGYILHDLGVEIDGVLELKVNFDEVVERIKKRAQIEGRADDSDETVRNRLEVYKRETAPITAFYQTAGKLTVIDGMGTVDEVWKRVKAAVDAA